MPPVAASTPNTAVPIDPGPPAADPVSLAPTDASLLFSRDPPDFRLVRIIEAIDDPAPVSDFPVPADGAELCVVASSTGVFAPKFASVKKDPTQLHWMDYRGFRQSPFLPAPRSLAKWVAQWRMFCAKSPSEIPAGSEPVKNCYICALRIDDPIEHHESEAHRRKCEALTEWDLFDQLKAELEAQFSRGRPI
jgi:hypothetical protein